MGARVARLQPRQQPIAVAVAEYRAGRFDACLGALHGNASTEALRLRARALLRCARPEAALEAADDGLRAAVGHAERGEFGMFRASALARLGRYDDAQTVSSEAKVSVFAAASAPLEAEYHALEAHRFFGAGDTVSARDACDEALSLETAFYVAGDHAHFTPLAHSRARAHLLLGALAARRADYAAQAAFVRASLAELDATDVADVALLADALVNRAVAAREFGDPDVAADVRARYEAMPWPAGLAAQQHAVLGALAWSNALRGNHVGAFRDLRAAADIAPTVAMRLRVALDRAYLARELHQRLSALEELDYAEGLANRIDWTVADPYNVDALLQLSLGIAPLDPARARAHFQRYRRLKEKLAPHAYATFDRRARAEELVADATIARGEGDVERSVRAFAEAFDLWEACGYRWRAALAAVELGELGAGVRFVEYARREAAARPNSWLAHRVGTASAADLL